MLIATHRLDHLADAIMRRFGTAIDFSKIQDKEIIASVGSVYALNCRGMDLSEYQKGIPNERYEEAFRTARKSF